MKSLLSNHDMTMYDESFTSSEIQNQPITWDKVWDKIKGETNRITSFLTPLQNKTGLNIVLTGAGSSAFVGDTVTTLWLKNFLCPTQAIPTTDLVTHFKERIVIDKPLLLISFARSGNSPESTAVIHRANELCDDIYHIIITCNPNGKLAQMENRDNTYMFLLPPETEDKSLAMTNSFTSMTLAATLIPKLFSEKDNIEAQIDILSSYGQKMIEEYAPMCYEIAQLAFKRIVFLGSGPLLGVARESHLKVQELTNGKVVGKFDSFLGFRHGPKAIINDDTLIVYLLSNNEYVNRYEKDLIDQIARHDINLKTLCIAETDCLSPDIDFCINMQGIQKLDEHLWAILCTLPAQLIGFYKSLQLGYNPDAPSENGTISRVVKGVTIYEDSHSKSSAGDDQ